MKALFLVLALGFVGNANLAFANGNPDTYACDVPVYVPGGSSPIVCDDLANGLRIARFNKVGTIVVCDNSSEKLVFDFEKSETDDAFYYFSAVTGLDFELRVLAREVQHYYRLNGTAGDCTPMN